MKISRALARVLAALLAVGFLIACPARGQSAPASVDAGTIPNTPSGNRLRELIDLMNSDDDGTRRTWAEKNLAPSALNGSSIEEHINQWATIRKLRGGVRFHSVRSDPNAAANRFPGENLIAIVQNNSDAAWRAIIVGVEAEPPHRITGIMIAPARPPKSVVSTEPLTPDQFGAEIRNLVATRAKTGFSGVVQVTKGDKTIVHEAVGIANETTREPIAAATRFNVASCTKMFTVTAAARLVERGMLQFEDPISKHLPPGTVIDATNVTVWDLASHTSGFGEFHGPAFYNAERSDLDSVDSILNLSKPWKPEHPRGEFHYSNLGFVLLGKVIESAAGKPFHEIIEDEVFRPASLTATLDRYRDETPLNAIGYMEFLRKDAKPEPTDRPLTDCRRFWAGRGEPSGGALCATQDLVGFFRYYFADRYFTSGMKDRLINNPGGHAIGSMNFGAGMAIMVRDDPALGTGYGHTGSNEGASAVATHYPDAGLTIVVLSNRPGVAADVSGMVEAAARRVKEWAVEKK